MRVTLAAVFGLCFVLAFAPRGAGAQTQPPAVEQHDDALTPPPPTASLAGTASRGPSQFMAGNVAVRVLLPESDSAQENWSQAQIDLIDAQIRAALDWWAARLPAAHLRFTVRLQVVPTAYEPINYGLSGEGRWIGDVLARLGYSGSSYFDKAYAADNALRDEFGADWATTIFVVNSQNNSSGTFTDGRFAYAYINGPFMVLTSDVGAYGSSRMAPVVAHEFGHIFGALDQYAAAGISCAQTSGYLSAPTTNSQYGGCGTGLPSIMIETLGSFSRGDIDPSALAQIGYRDSDNDGLIDPLDTAPQLSFSLTTGAAAGSRPTLSGEAIDLAYPAPVQQSASINRISAVEYRVNGGVWMPLAAADGAFDSGDEAFSTVLPLYDGLYSIEARARNSVDGWSAIVTGAVVVSQVGPQPAYGANLPAFTAHTEVQVQLSAPAGTQAVQLSADPGFSGAAWRPYQAALPFTLAGIDGRQTVYVRYRDAAGRDSLPLARGVTLDTTPPDGQALRDPLNPGRLLLKAHDDGAGVADVGLQLNQGAPIWMPFQADIDLGNLSGLAGAGQLETTEVRVLFRDAAGNTSIPYSVSSAYQVSLPLIVR